MNRALPRVLRVPVTIAAVTPCRVVPFQNSTMTSAGRFADAATLKAQPTR